MSSRIELRQMVRDLTLVGKHEVDDPTIDRFLEEGFEKVIHRQNWSWRAKELVGPVLAGEEFFDLRDFDPPTEPPPEPEVPPVEPIRPNITNTLIAAYDAFHLDLAHNETVDVWPSEGEVAGMSLSLSSGGKPKFQQFSTPSQMPGVHFTNYENIQSVPGPGTTFDACTIFMYASNPTNGIGYGYINDLETYQPYGFKSSVPNTFFFGNGSAASALIEVEDPDLPGNRNRWTIFLGQAPIPSAVRVDGVDVGQVILDAIPVDKYQGVRLGAWDSADLPGATLQAPDWTIHELLVYEGGVPGGALLALEQYLYDKWVDPWNLTVEVPMSLSVEPLALPEFGEPHPAPGITAIGDFYVTEGESRRGAWRQITRSDVTYYGDIEDLNSRAGGRSYWFDLPEYKIQYAQALDHSGDAHIYVFYSPFWDGHPDTEPPLIPVHFHKATIGNWAIHRVWERQEDFDRSDAYLGRFEIGMQELQYEENVRNADRPKVFGQLPNRRRRRFSNMPWLNGV